MKPADIIYCETHSIHLSKADSLEILIYSVQENGCLLIFVIQK